MSNYYGTGRTSYTKVRDENKFKEWVDGIDTAVLIEEDSKEHGKLYGMYFDGGDSRGIPEYQTDEDGDYIEDEDGDWVEFDIYKEIQPHLADGWSITFMEVGAEKVNYLVGFAAIVTPTEIEYIHLQNVVTEKLEQLGSPLSTKCED